MHRKKRALRLSAFRLMNHKCRCVSVSSRIGAYRTLFAVTREGATREREEDWRR
jgi:hypothetical protein